MRRLLSITELIKFTEYMSVAVGEAMVSDVQKNEFSSDFLYTRVCMYLKTLCLFWIRSEDFGLSPGF